MNVVITDFQQESFRSNSADESLAGVNSKENRKREMKSVKRDNSRRFAVKGGT